ncbi:MAG: hypothetical protein GEU28_05340 [Dehalococcoidia bacterium]|nr:hypothetical protein [Dehalococcoidia bacterium]
MTLILNNEEVRQAVTMADCVEAIEEAFIEVGRGWAMSDPRTDRYMPASREQIAAELGIPLSDLERTIIHERMAKDAHVESGALDAPLAYMFKTMFGAIHKTGIAALRTSSEILSRPVVNGKARLAKIPAGPGGRYTSLIQLFSTRTGQLLCIMPDGQIQRDRVVATGAVGTRVLARKNVRTMGLLGSGMMAGGSIEATLVARPDLELVKVYSPNRAHRHDFARLWSSRCEIEVRPVESAEEAVADVDIVVGATNSREPVIRGEWLRPGMHLNITSNSEIDEACYSRADLSVITWRAAGDATWRIQNYALPAAPEAEDAGQAISTNDKQLLQKYGARMPELSDLLTERAAGRADDEQITLHINLSAGVQFAALGGPIFKNARAKGLGREVPTDWFLEEMHP